MSNSYVYIIAKKLDDSWGSPVKVGLSDSPGGRLGSIQTASPFKVGIFQLCRFPTRATALEIEQAFHGVMQKHRLHGEWFDMTPEKAREHLARGVAAHMKVRLGWDWDRITEQTKEVFFGKVAVIP